MIEWCLVWCGVVWCGLVWCGVVWCGVVWFGLVWFGVVWFGVVCGYIVPNCIKLAVFEIPNLGFFRMVMLIGK